MKRKDLPFRREFLPLLADGRKTQTRRCSGLAAVNREPDDWTYAGRWLEGMNPRILGEWHQFRHKSGSLCKVCCPWRVGEVYPPANVRVVSVRPERVQDISEADCFAEGMSAKHTDGCDVCHAQMCEKFADLWNTIHRRDVRNRWARNPWCWRLELEKVQP